MFSKPQCTVPENIHTPPTEGIGISWGVGDSIRPKNLKKCMKLNWNFQRGGGVLEKIPSVGEVWIFSEITQLHVCVQGKTCKKKFKMLVQLKPTLQPSC